MKTEYPPQLDYILDHCPKAASFYVKAWRDRDSTIGETIYFKEQLINELSVHFKKIKHELMLLKRESVIKFSIQNKSKIVITFLTPSVSSEKAA